jgi:CheY-like chemotaxis protein
VLVVDDNATNRFILEEMLTNWGMSPTAVDGGPAALAALDRARDGRQPFALVLLDAMMPGMDGFTLAERIGRDPGLVGATLMMLSSAGQREDAARCRELGVATYLTKPVRQSTLLDAIMTALAPSGSAEPAPSPAEPTGWGTCARPLRVLLAEDNAVNQRLAVRLLEKRGHRVTVVGTGRAAVDALGRDSFDAVLMDVQMPEMDGLEATRVIRGREKATGGHVPVIAMTAHAMKGDREQCLAAGMDGYVSKPLKPEDLFAVLEGAVPAAAGGPAPPAPAPQPPPPPPGPDRAKLLKRFGGDADLLAELSGIFLDEAPGLVAAIRAAVAAGDAEAMRVTAHTLKGSVGIFEAARAYDAAARLEAHGLGRNPADAAAALADLEAAVADLSAVLTGLRPAPAGANP